MYITLSGEDISIENEDLIDSLSNNVFAYDTKIASYGNNNTLTMGMSTFNTRSRIDLTFSNMIVWSLKR